MTLPFKAPLIHKPQTHTDGFVLPYVLLTIAILAIVCTMAADRLMETSGLMRALDSFSEAEIAFMSAESQTTFSLLTGVSIKGGVELANTQLSTSDIFLNETAEHVPMDLWNAAGEVRVAETEFGPVYVTLRDVSGLVPLNTVGSDELIPFLVMFGISKAKAIRLSATLQDYRDRDHSRQFQGAERADYKLRSLPPPSNAPLRNYVELNAVLDWGEVLQEIDIADFKKHSTLSMTTALNLNFAAPKLVSTLQKVKDRKESAFQGDALINALAQGDALSKRLRLTFVYFSSEDMIWQRVIEIERQEGHPNKPFKRHWVSEGSLLASSLNFTSPNELKNVIHASSRNAQ